MTVARTHPVSTDHAHYWSVLAALAEQQPGFLGFALRTTPEVDLAVALGLSRVDVQRLKVCLLPGSLEACRVVERHFRLPEGRLDALLWPGVSHSQSRTERRMMGAGGSP